MPILFVTPYVPSCIRVRLAQRLGAASRAFVAEHYSWTSAVSRLNSLYPSLVARLGQQVLAADLALLS